MLIAPYLGCIAQPSSGRVRLRTHLTQSLREQHVSLGTHETEEDAARAYDSQLAKLPGDARPLNFPKEHGRAPGEAAEPAEPAEPDEAQKDELLVAEAAEEADEQVHVGSWSHSIMNLGFRV